MKKIAFLIFVIIGFNGATQDLDKLSKKELKALFSSEINKRDSILSLLVLSLAENQKTIQNKDSLIFELNKFLMLNKQKINHLENENTLCKLSKDSMGINIIFKNNEINKLSDSIQKMNNKNIEKNNVLSSITCSFKEEKIADCDYPVIVKYCYLNNYKNTRAAMPDFKGNYVDFYELFKKVNGKYVAIKNEDLFGENKNQLLEKINQKVKQNFNEFLTGPNASECFGAKEAPMLTFDDFSIDFAEESINFIVKYSMLFSCFTDKGTVVSFKLSEISSYIK
jgi:hypothetical protein